MKEHYKTCFGLAAIYTRTCESKQQPLRETRATSIEIIRIERGTENLNTYKKS